MKSDEPQGRMGGCQSILTGSYSEGVKGLNTPPEKYTQKFLGLPFCGYVGHVQHKNVTVTQ